MIIRLLGKLGLSAGRVAYDFFCRRRRIPAGQGWVGHTRPIGITVGVFGSCQEPQPHGRDPRPIPSREGRSMNIRTVLVTGANGFIGRQLTKGLLSEDVHVRCMVRKSAKRAKALSKQYMKVACGRKNMTKVSLCYSPERWNREKNSHICFVASNPRRG